MHAFQFPLFRFQWVIKRGHLFKKVDVKFHINNGNNININRNHINMEKNVTNVKKTKFLVNVN